MTKMGTPFEPWSIGRHRDLAGAERAAASLWASMFTSLDVVRRAQGEVLSALGFGPEECPYRVAASGQHWHLRDYRGPQAGPALLIVAAPIKKPYIWDLAPAVSVVRFCRDRGMRVLLLEWKVPASSQDKADLAEYAGRSIAEAIASALTLAREEKLFLMGHSLGGTLAAIAATLDSSHLRGLVLLGAPLCFEPGASHFRDALAAMAPSLSSGMDVVPGALLSQVSALASPQTFLWSRLADAALSLSDRASLEIHARVERWTLDEAPLPGALVEEIVQLLYCEDRFCRGTLSIAGETVGPSRLKCPTLAIVNTADQLVPPSSVLPFMKAAATRDHRIIDYPGETGVGLQHLAVLIGRKAHARIWPAIAAWLEEHR